MFATFRRVVSFLLPRSHQEKHTTLARVFVPPGMASSADRTFSKAAKTCVRCREPLTLDPTTTATVNENKETLAMALNGKLFAQKKQRMQCFFWGGGQRFLFTTTARQTCLFKAPVAGRFSHFCHLCSNAWRHEHRTSPNTCMSAAESGLKNRVPEG